MRTTWLFHLGCALLSALLFTASVRADPSLETFDGVWNVTIGPAQAGNRCLVAETSATRVLVPSLTAIVWVYWTYRGVTSPQGRVLTGTRPLDFESFTALGAPRSVVEAAKNRGLQGTLSIELAAEGNSFEGVETSHCIDWEGNSLSTVEPWTIPVTGRKIPITLRILDAAGQDLTEVAIGETFFVELVAGEDLVAPAGSWLLWYRGDVDATLDLPATGAGQRFRSGRLTVNPLPADPAPDYFSEARQGRLYAAPGKPLRFEFRTVVAATEVFVRATGSPPQ